MLCHSVVSFWSKNAWMRLCIVIRLDEENKPTIVVAGGEDSNGNKLQFDLNFEIISVLTKIFKNFFVVLPTLVANGTQPI